MRTKLHSLKSNWLSFLLAIVLPSTCLACQQVWYVTHDDSQGFDWKHNDCYTDSIASIKADYLADYSHWLTEHADQDRIFGVNISVFYSAIDNNFTIIVRGLDQFNRPRLGPQENFVAAYYNAIQDPDFNAIPEAPELLSADIAKNDGNGVVGCVDCGNPISIGTGNKFQQVTDYQTEGANSLVFSRSYNGIEPAGRIASMLGKGWRCNFDRRLVITRNGTDATAITAERADGQGVKFLPKDGNWTADSDLDFTLVQKAATWVVTGPDDTVETYDDGSSGIALLQSSSSRNGYTQTLNYAGGRLATVIDSFNRTLIFAVQDGLLQTVTTPGGLVLTYGYDSSGISGGAKDRLTSITYSTTPKTGQTYLYENPSLPLALTGIIDENGNRFASWSYDDTGRSLSSQHGEGVDLTTVSYAENTNAFNAVDFRTVTGPLGAQSTYKFLRIKGSPKFIAIDRVPGTTPSPGTFTQGYDNNGYDAGKTDWNTHTTLISSDVHGQPTSIQEAYGTPAERDSRFGYHDIFHLPTLAITPLTISEYSYDPKGNQLSRSVTDQTIGGQNRTWAFTYINFGQVRTATSPRTDISAVTRFGYDNAGNLSATTNALGHVTRMPDYNLRGQPLLLIDVNGVTNRFTYDVRGWLLTRTVSGVSGDSTTTFTYTASGQIASMSVTDGATLFYSYDKAQRLQAVTNSLGETISYALDAAGNVTKEEIRRADGLLVRVRQGVFDSLSRKSQAIGANNQTNRIGYDANGNNLSLMDALGNTTTNAFDGLNRQVLTVDPMHFPTGYGYDKMDNLTSLTDPRSLTTSFTRNGFGQITMESSPDRGLTFYGFDNAGNPTSEAKSQGYSISRTFDALERATTETFPNSPQENITYSYDSTAGGNKGIGHLTGFIDETGSTALFYDERGNVTRSTRIIGGHIYITTYDYDLANHLVRIIYPSGHIFNYVRESERRVKSVTYQPTGLALPALLADSVTYLPFGPLSGLVYGNGLTRKQSYDQDYRLIAITTKSDTTTVQDLSLAYNPANIITTITDHLIAARSQSFAYDPNYRLTNAVGIYGSIAYAYDPNGNRTLFQTSTKTNQYGYPANANRLTVVTNGTSVRSFTYTTSGNVATDTDGSFPQRAYVYKDRNRLKEISDGGTTVATYLYNALGQRLVKKVATTVTHFHYDNLSHLIAESDGTSGAMLREYVWLGDMPLAQVEADGKVHFIHTDHLNTPQKLTDGAQNVVWDRIQQPFGETVSIDGIAAPPALGSVGFDSTGHLQFTVSSALGASYVVQRSTSLITSNWTSISTNTGPAVFADASASGATAWFYRVVYLSPPTGSGLTMNLRFPGQYFDAESGRHYNLMRHYEPTLGRYAEVDPVGLTGGVNVYDYGRENPVNRFDLTGTSDFNFAGSDWEWVDPIYTSVVYPVFNGNTAYTIIGHGAVGRFIGNGKENIPPDDLAVLTFFDPNYNRGQNIFLYSCNTGIGGELSFAQQYADELRKLSSFWGSIDGNNRYSIVYAPNGWVHPAPFFGLPPYVTTGPSPTQITGVGEFSPFTPHDPN